MNSHFSTDKKHIKYISLIISFVYTFVGTVAGISVLSEYDVIGLGNEYLLQHFCMMITFPASMTAFSLLFAGVSIFIILVVESIVFFILWYLTYNILLICVSVCKYFQRKSKKDNDLDSYNDNAPDTLNKKRIKPRH